ncbi:MAG: hypothetical protein WKF30_08295 [Pyrinomonadaceae bacterium]
MTNNTETAEANPQATPAGDVKKARWPRLRRSERAKLRNRLTP